MITAASPMSCGNCGEKNFSIYQVPCLPVMLIAECQHCLSTTRITASTPEVRLDFADQGDHNPSQGILCVMHQDKWHG